MNNNITPDVYAVYTSTELEQLGFKLGDEVKVGSDKFVLSESYVSEDLGEGQCVKRKLRYTIANATITGSDELDTENPYILITNAGAAVVAGALAGLKIAVTLDGAAGVLHGRIKRNTVGASSATNLFKIFLEAPLASALTAAPKIEVWDPNYCETTAVTSKLQLVNGVCQVAVDSSVAPYFWRQVDGDAIVRMSDTTAQGLGVQPGGNTAGEAITTSDVGSVTEFCFGQVIVPADADGNKALVRLFDLS